MLYTRLQACFLEQLQRLKAGRMLLAGDSPSEQSVSKVLVRLRGHRAGQCLLYAPCCCPHFAQKLQSASVWQKDKEGNRIRNIFSALQMWLPRNAHAHSLQQLLGPLATIFSLNPAFHKHQMRVKGVLISFRNFYSQQAVLIPVACMPI